MHVLHKTFQRLCVARYEIKLMANTILCKHNYQNDGMSSVNLKIINRFVNLVR